MTQFPFSKEVCEQLVDLLNKNKVGAVNQVGNPSPYDELSGKAFQVSQGNQNSVWIFNSGASDHIICNPSLFTNTYPTQSRYVRLPNGNVTRVSQVGTVVFPSQFTLHNVLCVPSFYLNLISVSKLAYI